MEALVLQIKPRRGAPLDAFAIENIVGVAPLVLSMTDFFEGE